ncbi:hypothetical protein WME75_25970 [Sorangium sp. So ce1014]|uniref:hypothetical protein n=1 Tax=Sorangium sp. So ce1014 TaxID=3133326 RepID=UPI003F631FE1
MTSRSPGRSLDRDAPVRLVELDLVVQEGGEQRFLLAAPLGAGPAGFAGAGLVRRLRPASPLATG